MKKLLYAFGLVISLIACSEGEKAATHKGFTLKGKINNPANDEMVIKYSDDRTDTVKLNDLGEVVIQGEVSEAENIYLIHGGEYIPVFVQNDFDFSFAADGINYARSFKFSGKGAEANNFMIAYANVDEQYKNLIAQTFSLEPAAFLQAIDDQKVNKLNLLETNLKDAGLDEFYKASKRDIEFDCAYRKYVYPQQYFRFTKKLAEVDSSFFNFLEGIDMKNPENAKSENFLTLAMSIVYKESVNYDLQDTSLFETYEYAKVNYEGVIRDAILGKLVYGLVNAKPNELRTLNVYNDYKATVAKDDNFKAVEEAFMVWEGLKPGKPAPNFTFADINGNAVSLSDFKGKMVYIDAWATWCGPCIREVPALKAFIEENKNGDVVFMQVSVDRTAQHGKWASMVNENQVDAVQLFTGDNDKGFGVDYMIKSIPRFILIDKDGNFISSDAPRPSDPEKLKALMNI